MSDFNPERAVALAKDLEGRGSPPSEFTLTIAEQLRAACAEVERLRSIVDRHNDEAINQDETWCADRDRLAARVAELERLAGEACDIADIGLRHEGPAPRGAPDTRAARMRDITAIRAAIKGGAK
jgi:hypothetical protein